MIVGTNPNGTKFVYAEVDLGAGVTIYVDGNSKITAGNGSYDAPSPNAVSLPHQSTCPGATPSCLASCYVHGLEKHAPALYALYRQNERALHRVLMATTTHRRSAEALGAWIAEHCAGGFRWHVSGDIMHERHARWVASVCNRSSDVRHWIYTKSFPLVSRLVDTPNLTLNLSADRDNYAEACAAAAWAGRGARICYMSQAPDDVPADLPPGSVIFPDYPARGRETMACRRCDWKGEKRDAIPTDSGRPMCPSCAWSLAPDPTSHPWWEARTHAERVMTCPADFFGQSEAHRCGPCNKCMVRP